MAGGVIYAFLEIFWRGYTHWSMILAGACAAVMLYWIRENLPAAPLLLRCLLGAAGITLVELVIGCVVNLWWGLEVWNYSDMPLNLWGQICPAFSALWFLLCIPAFWLCGQIRALCRRMEEADRESLLQKQK
ncbi:MAG: hypothetical protein IJ480_02515 [Clostridia bacterium]|nr:hypothetical protein [Clostridia bacterium]